MNKPTRSRKALQRQTKAQIITALEQWANRAAQLEAALHRADQRVRYLEDADRYLGDIREAIAYLEEKHDVRGPSPAETIGAWLRRTVSTFAQRARDTADRDEWKRFAEKQEAETLEARAIAEAFRETLLEAIRSC